MPPDVTSINANWVAKRGSRRSCQATPPICKAPLYFVKEGTDTSKLTEDAPREAIVASASSPTHTCFACGLPAWWWPVFGRVYACADPRADLRARADELAADTERQRGTGKQDPRLLVDDRSE